MTLIEKWQYKYIEKCLYDYESLCSNGLITDTEIKMVCAIKKALKFFEGTSHEVFIQEYYFNAGKYRKKYTKAGHYRYICNELLHTDESNGYIIKREIIYKVAMYCFSFQVFK